MTGSLGGASTARDSLKLPSPGNTVAFFTGPGAGAFGVPLFGGPDANRGTGTGQASSVGAGECTSGGKGGAAIFATDAIGGAGGGGRYSFMS